MSTIINNKNVIVTTQPISIINDVLVKHGFVFDKMDDSIDLVSEVMSYKDATENHTNIGITVHVLSSGSNVDDKSTITFSACDTYDRTNAIIVIDKFHVYRDLCNIDKLNQ